MSAKKKLFPTLVTFIFFVCGSFLACSNFLNSLHGALPSGPPLSGDTLFWINNKETYSYERVVTLHSKVDDARDMRFSSDAANWTDWETYAASKKYTCAYANGSKKVYGEFRYNDGTSVVLSASIYFIDKIYMGGGATGDLFGSAVAVSADGKRIVAGIPGCLANGKVLAGGIAVCDWDGLTWSKKILTPSSPGAGDQCGFSVAISEDGKWVTAGSPYHDEGTLLDCGRVYVFHDTGSTWTEYDLYLSSPTGGEECGYSVALHYNSDSSIRVVVGACMANGGAGALYFWQWDGASWSLVQTISGSSTERLGSAVTFSWDGLSCASGAPQSDYGLNLKAGAAYTYSFNGSSWNLLHTLYASDLHADDQFGNSLSLSSDGALLLTGARLAGTPDFGKGYILANDGSSFSYTFVPSILTSDIQFGYSVCISKSGGEALFGAPRYLDSSGRFAGKVFLTNGSGTSWTSTVIDAVDRSGDDLFGYATAFSSDGSTIAIGAPGNATLSLPASGSVYIIRR